MATKKQVETEIKENVASYRATYANSKAVSGRGRGASKRAYQMMMDRNSGALDTLWKLFPDSPAWSETGWAQTTKRTGK